MRSAFCDQPITRSTHRARASIRACGNRESQPLRKTRVPARALRCRQALAKSRNALMEADQCTLCRCLLLVCRARHQPRSFQSNGHLKPRMRGKIEQSIQAELVDFSAQQVIQPRLRNAELHCSRLLRELPRTHHLLHGHHDRGTCFHARRRLGRVLDGIPHVVVCLHIVTLDESNRPRWPAT